MPTNDIEMLKWITMAYFSGTFILTLFNLNLYLFHKKEYLKRWLLSWTVISIGYLVLIIALNFEIDALFGVYSLFMLGFSYFFLLAASSFINFKVPKYAIYLVVLSGVLIALFSVLTDYVAWAVLIGYLVNGYFFFVVGYKFLKNDIFLSKMIGSFIILFSLVSFSYPFLSLQTWFSPWGYMVFGMLGLFIGMILFQIHFHAQREEFLKLQHELEYLIDHDPLTGIYNRSYINTMFDNIMDNKIIDVGLLFIDLNDFKDVNDQFGHRAGDDVLIKVTKKLKDTVGDEGMVCRFGGDEFIIILFQSSDDLTHQLKNKIIDLGKHTLYNDIKIKYAVGAAFRKTTSEDIDQLLDAAERSMYKNKSKQKA